MADVADEYKETGEGHQQTVINLPQATRLVRALRERGVEISRDYYRMDELEDELIGRWRHER